MRIMWKKILDSNFYATVYRHFNHLDEKFKYLCNSLKIMLHKNSNYRVHLF